jgi:hypothetical protein
MPSLFSNAEFRENITDNAFTHRTSVNLRDGAESQLYIRGCSIRGQSDTVSADCRIYKVASSRKGSMLACRGYNGVLPARYSLVGKKFVDDF